MFCLFGGLAHDFVIHPAHDKPWFYLHLPSPSEETIEFIHIPSGKLTELWKIILRDMTWCDWGLSPNKITPYFGKLWKKHIDPYKIIEVGDHFGRGQAPIQNQDHPSSELSTCLPWWFYVLHLWGSGYDSVSSFPYKINGEKRMF